MNTLHQRLRQKYEEQEKLYLEKYGEHSLDRVSFWEPQGYPDNWQSYLETAIIELKNAIANNTPLEQDSEDCIY